MIHFALIYHKLQEVRDVFGALMVAIAPHLMSVHALKAGRVMTAKHLFVK